MRRIHELGHDWQFVRRRAGRSWLAGQTLARPEADVTDVDLPHSWNATDTFRPGVSYYQGRGAYRVAFDATSAPSDGEAVWRLEIDGCYGPVEVWLNGRRAAKADGQYLGCWLDAGRWLQAGENVLALRMDNRTRSAPLPGHADPDFHLYGGLTGVRLHEIPSLHLRSRRQHLTTDLSDLRRAKLSLTVPVANDSARPRRCRVLSKIIAADGTARAVGRSEELSIPAESEGTARVELELTAPILWSPDDPHLYCFQTRLEESNTVRDQCESRIGLRTAEFRQDEGFFLNGERLELHGCSRHASIPGFGDALPPELHRWDAEQLVRLGCNFVRLSHYPQHPAFLDACDDLGLLVYAEVASWKTVRTGRWLRAAKRQLEAMILRDRNRPSVLIWGMGNEGRSAKVYRELRTVARSLDPGRPVSYAENHLYRARRAGTLGIPDVYGLNYELDQLPQARKASRLGLVLVTECMNPYLSNGDGDLDDRQLRALREQHQLFTDKPWVAGWAVWSYADYATPHRSRCRRNSGLVDAWRQPKPAADLFWALGARGGGFVTLHGDWGDHRDAAPERRIDVFTNCRRVEIRADGELVSEVENQIHTELDVPFRQTDLRAVGWRNGSRFEARLPVHGEAEALLVRLDRRLGPKNAAQTLVVEVQVVDSRGELVGCWNGNVRLSLSGPATLRSYSPDGDVDVTRGRGRCFVTTGGDESRVRVVAVAPGLKSFQAVLTDLS